MALILPFRAPTFSARLLSRSVLRPFSSALQLEAPRKGVNKEKVAKEKSKKKKKKHPMYRQYDLKDAEQFALCDAMRYIRAIEVGRKPDSAKYDCHIKLRTKKDGPVIRNQIRLPHSVKTDVRIAVICPPNSAAARQAREAGAALVGEEEVFEMVKSGRFDFDRCVAQPASLPKIVQAGLPRILGPRGLMPSVKLGTLVEDVGKAVTASLGGNLYRERQGVIRMAVGQLGFTPEQLRDNVKAFISSVKRDAISMSDQASKEVHEVVLSSTNSPGFTLSGEFKTSASPPTNQLSS